MKHNKDNLKIGQEFNVTVPGRHGSASRFSTGTIAKFNRASFVVHVNDKAGFSAVYVRYDDGSFS